MDLSNPYDRAAFVMLESASAELPESIPHVVIVTVPKPMPDGGVESEAFMETNLTPSQAAVLLRQVLAKVDAGDVTVAVPVAPQGSA